MPVQLYTNNASAQLAADFDIGDTEITLESGAGALFAAPGADEYQMATLVNVANGDIEIVKITDNTDDVLTVEREQEGTTEANFPAASSKVEARLTAGMLDKIAQNNGASIDEDVAIGASAVAENESVAIGKQSSALQTETVSLGYRAKSWNTRTVAIGSEAESFGEQAIAIGDESRCFSDSAIAIGDKARVYANKAFQFHALPCVGRDPQSSATRMYPDPIEPYRLSSMPVVISSPWADLGQGVAWQSSTSYNDGDVVYPITPNGFQYALHVRVTRDFDTSTGTFVQNYSLTSESTEPSWATTNYDVADANDAGEGQWQAFDWETDGIAIEIPDGMIFYPDEVGFICYNYDSVSDEPYVSIGTHADPTLLINDQQLTDITDDNERHRFTGLTKGITGDINFKLETKATGASSRFHGRFYARGILIQKQDQA